MRGRLRLGMASPVLVAGLVLWSPATAQPVGGGPGPWPMAGRNAAHTGTGPELRPPFREAWARDPEPDLKDGGPVAGPVVGPEAVVVVASHSVVALDPGTGDLLWSVRRLGVAAGPPAIAEGVVIFASGNGPRTEVMAARLADGHLVWRTPVRSSVLGAITVHDGTVFVGGAGGVVRALDAGTGDQRWSYRAPGRILGSVAVSGGRVFALAEDVPRRRATLVALDVSGGDERWRFAPQSLLPGVSSPAVQGGRVLFGTGLWTVQAVDADSGIEQWSQRGRAAFGGRSIPAASEGLLVLGDRAGYLYALDPSTGEERWVFQLPGGLTGGGPAVAGDAVVAGDGTGQVSAIDRGTGILVWKRDLGDGAAGPVALAGGRAFVAIRAGRVVALEHDSAGTLIHEESETTLFLGRALLNFALAFGAVGVVIVVLFRYALRPRGGS